MGVGVLALSEAACYSTRETRASLPRSVAINPDEPQAGSNEEQSQQEESAAAQLDELSDVERRVSELEQQLLQAMESTRRRIP